MDKSCRHLIEIFCILLWGLCLCSASEYFDLVANTPSKELLWWDFDENESSFKIPIYHRRTKKHSPSDDHDHEHHSHIADCGFTCGDGTCIVASKRCDGFIHCSDSSDELNCSCKDRIGLRKLCDGIMDCPSSEDEIGCGCGESEFRCGDQKCIPMSKLCDGRSDCDGSTDEMNCFRLHTHDYIRGMQSDGFLQRMISGKWYTICKESKHERYLQHFFTKACQQIVGELGHETPKILEQSWDGQQHGSGSFAMFSESELKFTNRTELCSSGKVFKVTCPEPKCGWPVSHHDKSSHSGRVVGRHHGKRSVASLEPDAEINDLTAKIVGGTESKDGDWPFIVTIYRNGSFHCGGQLISPEWVLTAAHCFHGYEKYVYEVQAGQLRRFSYSPHEQTREVERVFVHERYDSKIFLNDITLLKLNHGFYSSKYVSTACLAPPDRSLEPRPGQLCSVIGWGDLSESTRGPDHLQEVELPILTKCQETFTKDLVQLCAGYPGGGKDACQGDSGGPLVCRDESGRQILNGLVSFGRGCARPQQPGVYTRISSYVDWVESVVTGENKIVKIQKRPLRCGGDKCLRSGGECIFPKDICNRKVDCLDGSDEANCLFEGDFKESLAIDERAYTEIDEVSHSNIEHVHEIGNTKLCGHSEFQCAHTKSCVPDSWRCNGKLDCQDETDEKDCGCSVVLRNTFPQKICNGIAECLDGSDEMDCEYCEGKKNSVKCPFSETCVLEKTWCDGMKHCPDGEDELDCIRLVRNNGSVISDGFLNDKLSRGLQSGYVYLRTTGVNWMRACEEERGTSLDEYVCPYLGFRLKGDNAVPVWTRSTRTASFFLPRKLAFEKFSSRASEIDDKDAAPTVCTSIKVGCGDAHCGTRRLFAYSYRDPGDDELGAHPWFVFVSVEGTPVCPATLIHKNWVIVSSNCILKHIRSMTHEYVSVVSGFSLQSPIVTSPLEQTKRVNGIEKLKGGFSLLHLDSPIMNDHFAAPICTKIGDGIKLGDVARADCRLITHNDQDFKVIGKKVWVDTIHSIPGDSFAIRLNRTQCEESDESFIYCTTDHITWFYLGGTGDFDLSQCYSNGYVKLSNPFYGPTQTSTEEVLTDPPSSTYKPPVCTMGVRCSLGNCVEKSRVCDGIQHCSDSQDERRCQRHYSLLKSSGNDIEDDFPEPRQSVDKNETVEPPCPMGHFQCKTSGNCVPISAFCDQVNDCGPDDFSDEPMDQDQCSCGHYLTMVAPERVCDANGVVHCPDKSDELGCLCKEDSFYCQGFGKNECVHSALVCDGRKDCKNGQDEAECINLSISLKELKPGFSPLKNSVEGYVLARVKGVYYPYCSLSWSKGIGQQICTYLGWKKLDSMELSLLSEFDSSEERTTLLVARHEDADSDAFQVFDWITADGEEEWANCEIAHIRCSK